MLFYIAHTETCLKAIFFVTYKCRCKSRQRGFLQIPAESPEGMSNYCQAAGHTKVVRAVNAISKEWNANARAAERPGISRLCGSCTVVRDLTKAGQRSPTFLVKPVFPPTACCQAKHVLQ